MYGQMSHTLKAFIIIKTPLYLLKINQYIRHYQNELSDSL